MSERAVYLQRINPERRREYIDAYDEVPAEVRVVMERGGVEAFELYARSDVAVCVVDVEDIDKYVETVTDDPIVEEWERHVARFKTDGVDIDAPAEEQIPFMDRIFPLPWGEESDMDEQLSGSEDAREKGDFLIGTPAEVVEGIETIRDLGFTKLQLMFLDFPKTEGMQLFGDEVLPEFV